MSGFDHPPAPPGFPPNPAAERFYSGALPRIRRFMLAAAVAGLVGLCIRFGFWTALGWVIGCAIAWLNFYWLKRVVSGFADRVTASGVPQPGTGLVFRFFVRYFLMGLGAYAIFSFTPASVYGLLAGLFLPVAGIACEAACELYVGLRRGL